MEYAWMCVSLSLTFTIMTIIRVILVQCLIYWNGIGSDIPALRLRVIKLKIDIMDKNIHMIIL